MCTDVVNESIPPEFNIPDDWNQPYYDSFLMALYSYSYSYGYCNATNVIDYLY